MKTYIQYINIFLQAQLRYVLLSFPLSLSRFFIATECIIKFEICNNPYDTILSVSLLPRGRAGQCKNRTRSLERIVNKENKATGRPFIAQVDRNKISRYPKSRSFENPFNPNKDICNFCGCEKLNLPISVIYQTLIICAFF